MEAKKSKKAAIENQRGSWLLMGVVVALAFMFVSFEWTQHDVRLAASLANDPIFEEVLVPITYPEEKLEPPPPPEVKASELIEIVTNEQEVTEAVATVSEDQGQPYEIVWVPPVVETEKVDEDVIHVSVEFIFQLLFHSKGFPCDISSLLLPTPCWRWHSSIRRYVDKCYIHLYPWQPCIHTTHVDLGLSYDC